MDDLDKKIIEILRNHGRESHESIAKSLHLSRPAVHQRIKKLEEQGFIQKYKTIIDWSKLGYTIHVFIYVKINAALFKDVLSKIVRIQVAEAYLDECHRLAGEWCIMLKVVGKLPQSITEYIDEILLIEGVSATSTTFILTSLSIPLSHCENGG